MFEKGPGYKGKPKPKRAEKPETAPSTEDLMDEVLKLVVTRLGLQSTPLELQTLARTVTMIHQAKQVLKKDGRKKLAKLSDTELEKLHKKMEKE